MRLASAGQVCVVCAIVSGLAAASPVAARGTACRPAWRIFAHSRDVPSLSGVAALSDGSIWAVGGASGGLSGSLRSEAAVVHWDGRRLTTTRFPWRHALLADVDAASPDDVWGVGSIRDHALALHWNGLRWRRVEVWPWRGAWLSSVAVISPDNAWAAGGFRRRPLVAHWDGRRWHVNLLWRVAPNFADLAAITAVSADNVWASGEDGLDAPTTFGFGDLELRWDGRRWHRVEKVEHSSYDNVADATAASPNEELWELSSDYSGNGVDLTRWASRTGKELSNVFWEPNELPNLLAIAPLVGSTAWAVGDIEPRWGKRSRLYPFVAYWNGRSWRPVRTPFDHFASASGGLDDAVALSPTDVWAVGDHLIVHYSC
jgi:hypothetical protein